MIKRITYILIITVFFQSCQQEKKLSADEVVDKSIEASGGNIILNTTLDFDFRDIHYTAVRNNGNFKLGRNFIKGNDTVADWLTNSGFKRIVNNQIVKVADSVVPRYSASVNSVHYFSVLPYGLNDNAVNKTYLGEVTIKDHNYHKIKVTFNEEGGGEDFEDVFMYFINSKTFKVDYLAYSYEEDHGIGLRYREAYNERLIKGIRFVDYNNYRPKKATATLNELEVLFEKEELQLLSKIELEDIKVEID